MSRDKSQDPPNSSAENLLSSNTTSSEQIDNIFINPIGPNSVTSSPTSSCQNVNQDFSSPMKSKVHSTKRSSFDSGSHTSTDENSTPTKLLSKRANTISADVSSYSGNEKFDDSCLKEIDDKDVGSDADLLSNVAPSEASLWQDYQEPSTSYDASTRQLDEDSVTTLACERDSDQDTFADIDYNEDYKSPKKRSSKSDTVIKIIANKTSKQMYAAFAKEFGLECKMSDQCRCIDCQGAYLKCGEGDSGDGTDGGLGAGTPMFVSEAFGHGVAPACQII